MKKRAKNSVNGNTETFKYSFGKINSMKKELLVFSLIGVLLSVALLGGQEPVTTKQGIDYKATVCVYLNGQLIECKSNLITNIGKEFVEDQLTNPSTNSIKYISLSSSTSDPSESWTILPDEITTNGLERAECSITDIGYGQWSCEHTFTATGSVSGVRLAGLNWNSTSNSDNNLFAASSFTTVNLEANDQLLIRWNITIS